MTTRYKFSIWAFACLLLSANLSCKKDFLDRNPLNSVSNDVFWMSEADVVTAVAGVYTRLQQNFLGYERVYLDALSDNAWADPGNANQPGIPSLTTGNINTAVTSGPLVNLYSTPYRAIASCNYFLDNVDKAPVTEAKKNGYKAEVRFIRALAYFDLVQTYGGVIIYRNFPTTLEAAKIAKSSKEQVYAFIEEDLDFSIANLPDIKYAGHAVKGSAQALKARVLLTQEKWSAAATLLQQIISTASGKFGLANNYAALFRTAGQSSAAVNIEIMFATQYLAPNNVQRSGQAGMDIELGWFSLLQATTDLVNDYEMKDGKPAGESPLFDAANPYNNRDPRLDMSVKLPGEVWKNPNTGTTWSGSYPASAGFFITEKYVDLTRAPFGSNTGASTDQDYIHIRYADVLLMYAEAKNEATGPDASVYDAIDQVRQRAGMPKTDQAKYNTKEKLRDYIRHERRIELALEGQRYFDLKRWKIAHIKLPTLKTPSGQSLVFEEKHYVLPFTQFELSNNPALEQNTGY